MTRRSLLVAALLIVALFAPATAHARRGGIPLPIVWSLGEKVADLGRLPAEVEDHVAAELGQQPRVGLLYETAEVFWCSLWNWNGRYVLYAGDDTYWDLSASDWRALLGKEPSQVFGKPWRYRVPLVPVLAATGFAVWRVRRRYFPTADERLSKLAADQRYQRALETVLPTTTDEGAPFDLRIDERRFAAARDGLVGDGVPADVAAANLRELAEAVLDACRRNMNQALEHAGQLRVAGRHEEAERLLQTLLARLPADDPARAHADEMLRDIERTRPPRDAAVEV